MIANAPQHVANARTEYRRLRQLVSRIHQLCQQRRNSQQFYPQLLRHVVDALSAAGGAVWLPAANGRWQCKWQRDEKHLRQLRLKNTDRSQSSLAKRAAASGSALSFTHRDDPAIAEQQTVLCVAVRQEGDAVAVLEVVLPWDSARVSPQRELAFLGKMAELASVQKAESKRAQPVTDTPASGAPGVAPALGRLSAFVRLLHQSLDIETTGYTAVNEMRLMLGCDRVSLAMTHRDACRLIAISGQDTLDRRADTLRQLEALARAGLQTGVAVWLQRDDPQLPERLSRLGKLAHAIGVDSQWTRLGILPLRQSPTDAPFGTVIVEQIESEVSDEDLLRRSEIVLPHVTQALANARDHARIFLLPLWKILGRWKAAAATRWRRLAVYVAAALVAVLFLALFSVSLTIHGRGVLQPATQRDVFADVDGVVAEVFVQHGDLVQPGDALVRLHNSDLEVQIADLLGRRRAVQEHLAAIHRRRHEERIAREATDRLTGQMLQLQEQLRGLDEQHALLLEKQQRLIIRSPIAGRIATWNIHRRLMLRPVAAGQILLTIADEDGPWQLEVYIPEADAGHLKAASQESDATLSVQFLAVTEPETEHRGVLQHVDDHAQLYDDHGHAVRALVDIDRTSLPDTPAGATVRARIDCGRRSIGYVWLRGLLGFVYSRVLFRLG